LFDASIINSVIEENSDFFDGLLAKLSRPFAPAYVAVGSVAAGVASKRPSSWRYVRAGIILGLTSLVYALLDPGFGFNEASLVLLLSLLAGIAVSTYAFDGIQVLLAERRFGLDARILFYPFAILVACVSVLISRVVDVQPGIIYGFVAAATLTSAATLDERVEGQIIYISTLIFLGVALLSWVLVSPFRAWSEDGSFLGALLETVAVSVFVGGIQGILFTIVPLDFLDGRKLWELSKLAWVSIAVPVTFLFLHVILNPHGDFESPIESTSLGGLMVTCVVIWLLTAAVWLFFRQRVRMQA
jgi:hypothetical protein